MQEPAPRSLAGVGAIDVSRVSYERPGGGLLFSDVSFHVGNAQHVALVGENGVGKSTLLRLMAESDPGMRHEGTIRVDGDVIYMPQMVTTIVPNGTVRDLFLALSPPPVQRAAEVLATAEVALVDANKGGKPSFIAKAGLRLANAHVTWGDAGGYDAELTWDACCTEAVGLSFEDAVSRPLTTFSGGEQKRLALEFLLRSDAEVLLLDEPDNFLDVSGKRWLEERLNACRKTILYVSHDRELLSRTSHKIVTIEGSGAWTHGGGFATYHAARDDRLAKLEDDHRRWVEERNRLAEFMRIMKIRAASNDGNAGRARAAETRLKHFEAGGPPPERPKDQKISMRLDGARTGNQVAVFEGLAIDALTQPMSTEIWYGDRVAVVGPNGTGKSHFLRLLAGEPIDHTGHWRLGARVVPGYFNQMHAHPEFGASTLLEILRRHDLARGPAMQRLRRYELQRCADQTFGTLSGGQQARFQILLLELGGATLLLLDEPTDNLDLTSAEALEDALGTFEGSVIAVTHDRWFLRSFDRCLVFETDGLVVPMSASEMSLTSPAI